MGEKTLRVLLFVALLVGGIFVISTGGDDGDVAQRDPLLYQKGTYMGNPDTPISDELEDQLRDRARTDFGPRL